LSVQCAREIASEASTPARGMGMASTHTDGDRIPLVLPRTRLLRDEPRAAEGHPRAAVLDAEGLFSRTRPSVEAARHRDPDPGPVHVRLREHLLARGRGRRLR